MDVLTYALAVSKSKEFTSQAIQSLGTGFSYKGSVATELALPNNPSLGDLYTVDNGNASYVWDGQKWFQLTSNPQETLLSVVSN